MVPKGIYPWYLNLIEVVPVLHRKERRAGLKPAKRTGLLVSKILKFTIASPTPGQTYEVRLCFGLPKLRKFAKAFAKTYLLNPANALMVNATITVLNIKAIKLCKRESRLIFRSEISTSETWKVMPSTKEK
ncbi:hypothetical protein SRABI27_02309 [Pedobacter sp. Bi27]|nr:hypothetical protein SRABI27_02309 [Pedobacter sp. Bi27]